MTNANTKKCEHSRIFLPSGTANDIRRSILKAREVPVQDLRFSIRLPTEELSGDHKFELPLDDVATILRDSVDQFKSDFNTEKATQSCWLYSDSRIITGYVSFSDMWFSVQVRVIPY